MGVRLGEGEGFSSGHVTGTLICIMIHEYLVSRVRQFV